ncbi:MAG TPA: hypothetical protein VKA98_06630 [Nitrososphaeraceae archaeon]|nr:hypothetical protein [Nitrososphaeraceae archaeon]
MGRIGNLKCLPAGKPFLVSGIAIQHRYAHDGHKIKKRRLKSRTSINILEKSLRPI